MSLLEVIVATVLIFVLAGSLSTLMAAAVRSKLITASRSADTETARQTLEWITERIANAGLNLDPASQSILRCKDIIVAQDATMQPTATRIYVSGEILNTDTTSGNEVFTIGFFRGTDGVTGTQVVMEFKQACTAGAASTTTPLSDPRVTVSTLGFTYYSNSGSEITALTDPVQIRQIRIVRISLNVETSQGRSGLQAQTWARNVMLRNPEPNANAWVNPNENY